jgi:HipA-like protein
MRRAAVYRNNELVGFLTEENHSGYIFRYDDQWFENTDKPAVSLTMPKTEREMRSAVLFPFFSNMLSEGVNRRVQCRQLRIDENDDFGLLLATANDDTIGAITVKPLE